MLKNILIITFLFLGHLAMAQDTKTITGSVRDSEGFEMPGVSIVIKGTMRGTITNFDGEFTLEGVATGDLLQFSSIGMKTQEIEVGNETLFNIVLLEDVSELDEVVVIGYGSAKSKDLTSPIATISSEELIGMNSSSPMDAVQGKVAGVTVVNSGAPGDSPSVNIRGIGSMANTSPLYVVDGMFLDDINFLSPNDIESMSILKDASAAAIYGVRAANGVVLITTKGGAKNRPLQITYDGYYGVQSVTQRLQMANSEEYANFLRATGDADKLRFVEASIERYGGANGVPGVSTDWYDEMIRGGAPIQSHNLSLAGGGEKSTYAFGVGYFSQDGIMNSTGKYDRINFRSKVDYDVSDKLKIGFSAILTKEDRMTDNNMAWFQAFVNNPMYPVYDETLSDSDSYPKKFAAPHNLGYGTYYSNPVAMAYYGGDNMTDITRFLPTIYAELKPFANKDITFRSSLNLDYRYGANRNYTPEYKVGDNHQVTNSLTKSTNWNYDYVWDNIATWDNNWGNHRLKSMAGFSMREENYRWLTGSAQGVTNKDYLSSGDASTRTSDDGGSKFRGFSAFTRFSYDYKQRYLASLTMRADGSSKYQEKWGYFPSLGLGWVASEENFFKNLGASKIDFFKVRASYGILGNDRARAEDGVASIANGGLDESGIFGGVNLIPGMINSTVFGYLSWEKVHETNVGLDTRFFGHRLNLEADYYLRDTKDMVIPTELPMGNGVLWKNAGSVRNSGFELSVDWADQIGKNFRYSVGANITTINNKVLDLNDEPYLSHGSAEFPQRSYVGQSMYSFYGWKIDGVYQNQAEIDASPIAKANGLKPGDFRYVDTNGDGVIDDNDRQLLGDPYANFTYGLNLGVGYKGFNLVATFQGVSGATIFNRKRADINKHPDNNIDSDLANNLWNGEGSTNSYPSAEGMFNTWNTGRLNDFFLEDASYFRIQNIRVSYDLPKTFMDRMGLGAATVYVNADRPYTWFKSNGFTPEVAGGIDQMVYPVSSVFSLGASITF
ncbi:TonB-dependent receptor [Prolixibacteraceae bacterium Z1-6]|uniref:TonB-dependent receptor n=1 Tax=Draconibacterium aestuarii TaxID=2998507 RepID=A0A9X3F6F5_9BACT|nr:TonB-dependent receptor [Prolixibacteraceae bacterium Z1-6]